MSREFIIKMINDVMISQPLRDKNINGDTEERDYSTCDGCSMVIINLLILITALVLFIVPPIFNFFYMFILAGPMFIVSAFSWIGLFTIQPNEAGVLVFYGKYKGTVKESGFHWVNPLMTRHIISLKSRNLNGEILKVNDKIGNPIQIAAVVIWKIKNTAKALFDVENYEYYVKVQYEAAVRNLAHRYAYDKANDNEVSLRSGHEQVTKNLMEEMHDRLFRAGIEVEDARITTLSYASEIANAMLKRQQAEAIISAREKIVQGAVSIVGHAINSLHENKIVDLSNEEKSKLVSNMLIVLCSDNTVTPTLNTGS
jgi:regulator of protease activity HflC (stomatin/prohibitin superfamily)